MVMNKNRTQRQSFFKSELHLRGYGIIAIYLNFIFQDKPTSKIQKYEPGSKLTS